MMVGDVYLVFEPDGALRAWRVDGVHLGAVGQESLVELHPLTERPGAAHGSTMATYVPERLLRAVPRYTLATPGPSRTPEQVAEFRAYAEQTEGGPLERDWTGPQ